LKKPIRLGILFGGRSGEHEVSLQSAASIMRALDPAKYEVVPIGITRQGRWLLGREGIGQGPEESLRHALQSGKPVTACVDPTGPQLIPLNALPAVERARLPRLDVIFPALHGTFGEDGTVQGLLELAGIPYVGAGVLGSAAGMDKDVMKRLFRDGGLPVAPWILVLRSAWEENQPAVCKAIARQIRYPLFVKPANLGSSVGISKVHRASELSSALENAARYDRKILVEKAVNAREIECAVLGNDHPQASVPGEVVPANEFYDYEAKYLKAGSKLLIPAPLTPAQTRKAQDYSLRAFRAVDCAGMGRVDMLLDRKTGKLYVNEINTIPGFTSISMYPKLWEASGLSYRQLIDRLVKLAIERHREKSRTTYSLHATD
jgi:D-alanine-D-alanine ligase